MITLENFSIVLPILTIALIDNFCATLFNNLKSGHRDIAFLKFFFCFSLVIISLILAWNTQNKLGLFLANMSLGELCAMFCMVTTNTKK